MHSNGQDLMEFRRNPEYLNYIAVGDALRILTYGLRRYTEQKMKELHTLLLAKLGGAKCRCPCIPGSKPSRHTCPWSKELQKWHHNKRKSRIPWHQCDGSKWHDSTDGYWEIAKVFMSDLGLKWRDVKDPNTTDLTGILNLLIFCKHFKIQSGTLMKVRDMRNYWAHAPNFTLSESEKTSSFADIGRLMDDVELMSCAEVQECRANIEEIRNADISVVHQRDLLVLQEIAHIRELENNQKLMEMIESISKSNDYFSGAGVMYCIRSVFFLCFFMTAMIKLFLQRSRRFQSLLFFAVFCISFVSDKTVFDPDYGCSRHVDISPASGFGFQEFNFTPYLSYKRENFFGRRWFFRELEDIFESSCVPAGVLITGDPGSGKSALMSQLICSPFSALTIHSNIIGYHVCDYSEKGKGDGTRFVRNLVDQIASSIPEYADYICNRAELRMELKRCNQDPTACFFTTIIAPLRELKNKPDGFRYIVVDALDECVERDGEISVIHILRHKISYFPPWLKVILSSRNGTTVTSQVPHTVQRVSLNPADERNIEDIRKYISRYLSQNLSFMDKLLQAVSVKDTSAHITFLVEELVKRGDGNFLFVKTVLQNNVDTNGMIDLTSLPNSLHDVYDRVFFRLFAKEDFSRYQILFEILLASGSFKESEVFDILKRQGQGADIRDLLQHISSLLHFGPNGTVSIYHQSFAEWLGNNNKRVSSFTILETRGHMYIADFLIDRLRKTNATMTFTELSKLCMHVLYSGGPTDVHLKQLELLNVTNVRNPENGRCILHDLAKEENASLLLEAFHNKFLSVDILDIEGKTPAYYAAAEGKDDNLRFFLDKGAQVNSILKNLSFVDEIKSVVQMKGYEDLSILHVAAYNGHSKVVDLLLKYNKTFDQFSPELPTLLNLASERGHLGLVKVLHNHDKKADVISLHHAAARNHSVVVEFLLETMKAKDECFQCHAKFNSGNRTRTFGKYHEMFCETALHSAVSKNYLNIAKLLLRFGNHTLECKHHSGKTPLMDAVERNNTDMAELLLENGASVETTCGEETNLHFQNQISHVRSFYGKRFLYTFYREKTSCACGNKVLHLCAKYGLWHMAKRLIEKWNASVVDKNCKGETVWKIANVSHNGDFIYHVNFMLLNLDDKLLSTKKSRELMPKQQRRTLRKLLREFVMRAGPYRSSFQCDSAFEGMSPLHVAALMGVNTLNIVHNEAKKIAPSLPINCTNKHWIVPKYLANFYDSVYALTSEGIPNYKKGHSQEDKKLLQYPDREAEYHIMYNYLYHSPLEVMNVLTYQSLDKLEDYDITDCPGFYDLLPKEKYLRTKPYCHRFAGGTGESEHEEQDASKAALQETQFCKGRRPIFCVCISEIEVRMHFEQYARDCFCPVVMKELQMWFTSSPRKNRRVSLFMAERMGWESTVDEHEQKRWPVFFLYKKLKNEYQAYNYLHILNEGIKIKNTKDNDDRDVDL